METQKKVSLKMIADAFAKISEGLHEEHGAALNEELLKLYPTDESEAFVSTDYSEDENSVGVSVYLSKPQTEVAEPISFGELMFDYLIRTDLAKLPQVWDCIERMERKEGEGYDVDFIPVFYTEPIDQFDIHFRIFKQ